jgi:hypothetical protein
MPDTADAPSIYSGRAGTLTFDAEVARGDAGLAVTRVTVTAPLPGGITHIALRQVPLAEILRSVRAGLALAIAGDVEIPQTSGRTTMTDELLRAVAMAYIEETGPGKDKRAMQRMANRFGRPEDTVRRWVARARRERWLGPGSKGRIGAEPGPRLIVGDLVDA